jgi:hypothetical protein
MKFLRMILTCFLFCGFFSLASYANETLEAQKLISRLTGMQFSIRDPMFIKIQNLLNEGKKEEAAALIVELEIFYYVKVKQFASQMLAPDKNKDLPLDDMLLTFMGAVKNGEDARTLLTGNFLYVPDSRIAPAGVSLSSNAPYENLAQRPNYLKLIKKQSPQWKVNGSLESAGLLTTRGWANIHYHAAATNRSAVRGLFNSFLCKDLEEWRDKLLEDSWVRRDVARNPGGDPVEYQNRCKSCHAPMDAIGGAFAYLDFKDEKFIFNNKVTPKYLRNSDIFPNGYAPVDNSWENLAIARHNKEFGWNENYLTGVGVHALGEMVAESEGFKKCMSIRVVESVCQKTLTYRDPWIQQLATEFAQEAFNLKTLFKKVAIHENCHP